MTPWKDKSGNPVEATTAEIIPLRGYHVYYRGDGTDSCPGCGRQHFYVGRVSAECAFCGTALPIMETSGGPGTFWTRGVAA